MDAQVERLVTFFVRREECLGLAENSASANPDRKRGEWENPAGGGGEEKSLYVIQQRPSPALPAIGRRPVVAPLGPTRSTRPVSTMTPICRNSSLARGAQ